MNNTAIIVQIAKNSTAFCGEYVATATCHLGTCYVKCYGDDAESLMERTAIECAGFYSIPGRLKKFAHPDGNSTIFVPDTIYLTTTEWVDNTGNSIRSVYIDGINIIRAEHWVDYKKSARDWMFKKGYGKQDNTLSDMGVIDNGITRVARKKDL